MRKGYIVLTYEFHTEGKRWVGLCQELSTSTFGRSLKETEDRLNEAVDLHIGTLTDVGEIEQFLKEHEIIFRSTKPNKETKICISADESVYTRPHIQHFQELTPA